MLGEKANRFKAQILSGKHGRRCGGHKREGECALPGEVCPEQRAEVSRGHSNLTSTNIVDFEGIYFRNPLVSLHVDSQKCFVVTE